MTASQAARLALYSRLQEVLGGEHADTLIASLPMENADQLATRGDIDRLEGRIDRLEGRIDRLERRIEALTDEVRGMHAVMRDQLRTYTITTLGAMTALTAIYGGLLAVFR